MTKDESVPWFPLRRSSYLSQTATWLAYLPDGEERARSSDVKQCAREGNSERGMCLFNSLNLPHST